MRYDHDGVRFGLLRRRLWLAAAPEYRPTTGQEEISTNDWGSSWQLIDIAWRIPSGVVGNR